MSKQEEIELQKQIQILENNIKKYLAKEALTRYFTIKTANPEFALQVIMFLNQAINQKYIKGQISDEEFKYMLKSLQSPKKEFKIIK